MGGDIRYWLEMTSFWFIMVLLVTSNIAKRSLYPHAVDAVGTQYAVGVSAKRSTHTADLAHMGGGDHYL